MFQFQSKARKKTDVPALTVTQEEFPVTCGKVRLFVLFRPSTHG